jgi:4-hydroxy-tetrahydrodipicolinate synthase
MNRDDVDWKGLWPASVTPFERDGSFVEETWRELLSLHHELGMHGILVNGSSGEWFSQSDEERLRIAKIAVEELGGKLPVVIGCTHYRADWVLELTDHAAAIGADGVLVAPPPYARPTMADVLAFYEEVDRGVRLPLVIYNMPPSVCVDIDTETMARLVELDNVVAVKDSTPKTEQAIATLLAVGDKVRVFGNFLNRHGLALLREIGGDGLINGGALLGREEASYFEAVWDKDWARARAVADKAELLSSQLWTPEWSGRYGSSQAQMKAAMRMLGQPGGWPRRPLLPIEDPERLGAIAAALESVGLEPLALTA